VLAALRQKTYAQLRAEFAKTEVREIASGGRTYQVEVEAFWDEPGRKGGNLRVSASVTDTAWSGFIAVDESFIITPDGRLIGD
jgi:hypothetical protein